MRIVFIIQGEGRGHITQALALEDILLKAGHEVSDVIIGTCNRRNIPTFFSRKTKAQIHKIESPNFYFDKNHKSINLKSTFSKNVLKIPRFLTELKTIHQVVRESRADTVINFYDVLGGFYFLLYRPKLKRICLAHQYLASHSQFPFEEGYPLQKFLFKFNNRITSCFAHKRLALSFQSLPHEKKKLYVIPPLIRKEVLKVKPTRGDYILAYVVNKGYGYDILKWHEKNPKVKINCFWDNYDKPDEWSPRENITFHHINDAKFIDLLANCMGYVSTAGFESICEAMFLEKPVMMVPVKGQYEQLCNALDAQKVGAGIVAKEFNLDELFIHISSQSKKTQEFKNWVRSNQELILKEIEGFDPYLVNKDQFVIKAEELTLNNR